MTVRELAKLLSSIPEEYQDLDVLDCSCETVEGKWKLLEDYPLGDYANPKCEYKDFIYLE